MIEDLQSVIDKICIIFIENKGKICSREQILNKVWKDEVVVLDRTIDVRTVYETVLLIHKAKIDQKLFVLLFNKVCEDIRDRYKEKYIVPQNMAYRPVDSLNDATTVYADYTSALEEGILYYAGTTENKNKFPFMK